MTLTIANAKLSRAEVLDANLEVKGQVDLQKSGDHVVLQVPQDAIYIVLR